VTSDCPILLVSVFNIAHNDVDCAHIFNRLIIQKLFFTTMLPPSKKQTFSEFDALRNFVDNYATANKFGTKLWNTRRSKMNFLLSGKIVCRQFGCYAGRKIKDFKTQRCNCPFSVSFKRSDGAYHITDVILNHNHLHVC